MNWDYLAGFFDGEGSISLAAAKSNKENIVYKCSFSLSNNNREVLDRVREFLVIGGVYTHTSKNPNARTGYTYAASGKILLPILKELEPRLAIKQKQVKVAIVFIERRLSERTHSYTDEDFDLVREMRRLNDRAPGRGKAVRPLPEHYDKRTGWHGQARNRIENRASGSGSREAFDAGVGRASGRLPGAPANRT